MKQIFRKVYKFTDEETGEAHSITAASKITGIKISTLYTWHKDNGCRTIQSIRERADKFNPSGKEGKKFDTLKGKLSAKGVSARILKDTGVEIPPAVIYSRSKSYGWMSEALWFTTKTRGEFEAALKEKNMPVHKQIHKVPPKRKKFDRAATCWRKNFQYGCKNYSDALWDLCDGKIPRCYISDGSCYDEIDTLKM